MNNRSRMPSTETSEQNRKWEGKETSQLCVFAPTQNGTPSTTTLMEMGVVGKVQEGEEGKDVRSSSNSKSCSLSLRIPSSNSDRIASRAAILLCTSSISDFSRLCEKRRQSKETRLSRRIG